MFFPMKRKKQLSENPFVERRKKPFSTDKNKRLVCVGAQMACYIVLLESPTGEFDSAHALIHMQINPLVDIFFTLFIILLLQLLPP